MTVIEKLNERRGYVKAAFIFMVLIPTSALIVTMFGIDVSTISGIFATASATFSAIIIGHFATTPKDDRDV